MGKLITVGALDAQNNPDHLPLVVGLVVLGIVIVAAIRLIWSARNP